MATPNEVGETQEINLNAAPVAVSSNKTAKFGYPSSTETLSGFTDQREGSENELSAAKSGSYVFPSDVSYTGSTTLSERKKTKQNKGCYRLVLFILCVVSWFAGVVVEAKLHLIATLEGTAKYLNPTAE